MRTVAALLLVLITVDASAKWQVCTSTCNPPTGNVSGLSSLPLYAGNVHFSHEVIEGGAPRWLWLRVDPPKPCTPQQLADPSDKIACEVKVGGVLFKTSRIRNVP